MNLIAEKIKEIKEKEKLTTAEIFIKYPHLADLLMHEQQLKERKTEKQLLKG